MMRKSKDWPRAAAGVRIWMGALGDAGVKGVVEVWRESARRKSEKRMRRPRKSRGERVSRSASKASEAWYSRLVRVRGPGKAAVRRRARMNSAQSAKERVSVRLVLL